MQPGVTLIRPGQRLIAPGVRVIQLRSTTTFSLDFTGGTLPGGVTLTRSTTGNRNNSSGIIESIAINTARFDYNPTSLAFRGLLIEPSQTNLLTFSSQIDDASWTKQNVAITANSTTDPASGSVADSMVPSSGSGTFRGTFKAESTTGTKTVSAFVKKGNSRWCYLMTNNGNYNAWFDLDNVVTGAKGSQVTSSSIEQFPNSWRRISATYSILAGTNVGLYVSDADNSTTATGDGATVAIYAFGLQVVTGSYVGSYVATTSSTATRGADSCGFTIPSGVTSLRYTFDDNSTQTVSVSPGAYTIPTSLNRPWIKTIVGF